jgi:hypothetical protein
METEIRIVTAATPKVGQPVIGVYWDENGSERTIKTSTIRSIQELSWAIDHKGATAQSGWYMVQTVSGSQYAVLSGVGLYLARYCKNNKVTHILNTSRVELHESINQQYPITWGELYFMAPGSGEIKREAIYGY